MSKSRRRFSQSTSGNLATIKTKTDCSSTSNSRLKEEKKLETTMSCTGQLKMARGTTTLSEEDSQRKFIQRQGCRRKRPPLTIVGVTSFLILFLIDRATTSTTSSSKWARMMYDDPHYRQLRSTAQGREDERPQNLHLAFVGDSVTRYMYLDLVYYLKHNQWIADTVAPNILNAKHYPSWNEHYKFSNLALSPNEQCDCFRNNPSNASAINKEETIENRYFSDTIRNNYVTFIEVFGGYPAHGHWLPPEVHRDHGPMDFEKLQTDPFTWRYDWPGLIRHYLNDLNPKPDYLIFNEGLWIEHELGNAQVRQSIKDALDDTGIVGIYKTTTLPNINSGLAKRSAGVVFNRHDDAMCELIDNVLDFTWTKDLGGEHYWDGVHFMPHVNRGMNMELLDLLKRLDARKQHSEKPTRIRGGSFGDGLPLEEFMNEERPSSNNQ